MFKILGIITAFVLLLTTIIKPADVKTVLRNTAYNVIKPNENIIKIKDNLYISDYDESVKYDDLKNLGIKQILTIGAELPEHKTNDFKLKHIKIDDMPNVDIKQYFTSSHKFIDDGSTLVHCYAGISRSASIIISYLMRNGMSYEDAYNYVKARRPIIRPNRGFRKQLLEYEKELSYKM